MRQECLLNNGFAPHELRPTTPEIEVETYHKLVAQTLKDVMQRQDLVTKAEMVEDMPTTVQNLHHIQQQMFHIMRLFQDF
jgi:hypothetical protein